MFSTVTGGREWEWMSSFSFSVPIMWCKLIVHGRVCSSSFCLNRGQVAQYFLHTSRSIVGQAVHRKWVIQMVFDYQHNKQVFKYEYFHEDRQNCIFNTPTSSVGSDKPSAWIRSATDCRCFLTNVTVSTRGSGTANPEMALYPRLFMTGERRLHSSASVRSSVEAQNQSAPLPQEIRSRLTLHIAGVHVYFQCFMFIYRVRFKFKNIPWHGMTQIIWLLLVDRRFPSRQMWNLAANLRQDNEAAEDVADSFLPESSPW